MKKYKLDNLDCPYCAAKIEEGIKNLECVKDAKVVFATKTLMIDTDNIHQVQSAIDEIEKGVKGVAMGVYYNFTNNLQFTVKYGFGTSMTNENQKRDKFYSGLYCYF